MKQPTPPNDGSILNGITRNVIGQIKGNLLLLEGKITKPDLLIADDVFLTGTYSEIIPVVEVDGQLVGKGKSIWQNLYKEYQRCVQDEGELYKEEQNELGSEL